MTPGAAKTKKLNPKPGDVLVHLPLFFSLGWTMLLKIGAYVCIILGLCVGMEGWEGDGGRREGRWVSQSPPGAMIIINITPALDLFNVIRLIHIKKLGEKCHSWTFLYRVSSTLYYINIVSPLWVSLDFITGLDHLFPASSPHALHGEKLICCKSCSLDEAETHPSLPPSPPPPCSNRQVNPHN